MTQKLKKIVNILICFLFAACAIAVVALFLYDLSDIPAQKKDNAKIESINAFLTTNKDKISSYSDAMKILAENNMDDFSLTQRRKELFYMEGDKKVITVSSFNSKSGDFFYQDYTLNPFNEKKEYKILIDIGSWYYFAYFISSNLDVTTLRGCLGEESIFFDIGEFERKFVDDYMTNSVFFDGEAYSYTREKDAYLRYEVEDIRSADYFGYRLVIADGVSEIESDTFNGSCFTSVQMNNEVKKINRFAFSDCRYLETVQLSSSLTEIESNAFSNCSSFSFLDCDENLVRIGSNAFQNCVSLAKVNFSEGIEEISPDSFTGCELVSLINYNGSREDFDAKKLNSYFSAFPGRIIRYKDNFYNNGYVTYEYDDEEKTFFPNKYIGYNFFASVAATTTRNEEKYLSSGIGEQSFIHRTFLNCFYLPNGVPSLGERAFYHSGIRKMNIPASVENIGAGAFGACHRLKSFEVDEKNEKYVSVDGVLFEIDGENATLLCYPSGRNGDYRLPLTIKKGSDKFTVTNVANGAFDSCVNLRVLNIPSKIEYSDECFVDCPLLKVVEQK